MEIEKVNMLRLQIWINGTPSSSLFARVREDTNENDVTVAVTTNPRRGGYDGILLSNTLAGEAYLTCLRLQTPESDVVSFMNIKEQ